ncbi:universal stress protein [Roseobacter denitrificans]|uniref:Universal stress family protein, putative n=1 Tax=Roseobacter denitrificans (strain ATCC 33942 / OCh 114) TaxID=375451 RepID=Q161R8_ROSDO|nr:universal stress protein [Roseobacter denitrificans]ABG33275.1 universal stress family protein, putative [Roseobacter denitrificans OCh 114]AVL52615.1 universal stress protein [Roseobacter denitrificans]SFG21967.1 Nucleotide-binding universal stress protein, UspA family [Roseobacter denitrificans OCh 114]
MYKKIIVCLALDHGISETALAKAKLLLDDGGEIIALHVHELPSGTTNAYVTDDIVERERANAEKRLLERVQGIPNARAVLINGHTGRSIAQYAKEQNADCIILGSHKPGLSDFFLGSTAARIVQQAHCSVVVLR